MDWKEPLLFLKFWFNFWFGPKAEESKLLTDYERQQIQLIKDWRAKKPSVVSKSLGVVLSPVTWLTQKIIPEAAILRALDLSSAAAKWLTDTQNIIRDGNVNKLEDLKSKDLELSDKLADNVHKRAIRLAAAEGGVTGALGLPGIAADIPIIITFALKTIYKIGACYGFEAKTKQDEEFILSIMAASGSNDIKDKAAALAALKSIQVTIAKQTWKKMTQKAVQDRMSKEAAIISVKTLAKELGVNLTKRKALQAIPAIGALVGASVNAWYIKDVAWTARRAFQERWLIENGKISKPI